MKQMASFWRTHLNFLIGILISAVAVYLSLRKIDFHTLGASLRSVNLLFLIIRGGLALGVGHGISWIPRRIE